jgi:DNA-binding CsgD family transcriptional regulator
VELRRFEPGEVAAQLGAILGTEPPAGLVDLVFDRSGGNAYLVEELAGLVRGGGDPADLPPSLADVLLSRVDALSPEAQRLLRTAAVAGRSVPDKLLAEVAAVGEAVAPAAEDPLARFGLTEREREIVVLLAAGRSNPQIAEALFISPKTASVHVSNILAKLGVDSRVEAAAVAHRLGVTG